MNVRDRAARRIGMLANEQRVLGVAAAGDQRVDAVAALVHRFDDVARAVGDGLYGRHVEQRKALHAVAEPQAAHHAV